MVLWRCLPLLALSALPFSMSAALSTPPSLSLFATSNIMNVTQSSLEAPSEHPANLTYAQWPSRPFYVELHPRFSTPLLTIWTVDPFQSRWPIRIHALQDFLREFRNNLESEYPIPGSVPSTVRQSTVDVESYSSWTIEFYDSIWGLKMPTEFAVCALDEMAKMVAEYGPATLYFGVQEGRFALCNGELTVKPIGSGELSNRSLSN